MEQLDKIWENMKTNILKYVLSLQTKGYEIPLNDNNNELFTQNKFINASILTADLICIIITLLGLRQQLLTFIGVITYCIYTLSDQIKIYLQQKECLLNANNCGYFLYKNRKKVFPPNQKHVCIISVIFIALVVLALNIAFNGKTENCIYYIIIICSYTILFKIKVEFIIHDTLGISKWKFVDI